MLESIEIYVNDVKFDGVTYPEELNSTSYQAIQESPEAYIDEFPFVLRLADNRKCRFNKSNYRAHIASEELFIQLSITLNPAKILGYENPSNISSSDIRLLLKAIINRFQSQFGINLERGAIPSYKLRCTFPSKLSANEIQYFLDLTAKKGVSFKVDPDSEIDYNEIKITVEKEKPFFQYFSPKFPVNCCYTLIAKVDAEEGDTKPSDAEISRFPRILHYLNLIHRLGDATSKTLNDLKIRKIIEESEESRLKEIYNAFIKEVDEHLEGWLHSENLLAD